MFFFTQKNTPILSDIYKDLQEHKDYILVDVRTEEEYRSAHAQGAKNIPLSDIEENTLTSLKKHPKVYVICQSGGRSSRATDIFVKGGVAAVNVPGGTSAWKESKLPLE